jgi:hypothetical protein
MALNGEFMAKVRREPGGIDFLWKIYIQYSLLAVFIEGHQSILTEPASEVTHPFITQLEDNEIAKK